MEHCVACHGEMMRRGAPLRLTQAEDFHVPWLDSTAGQRAVVRMRDDERPMPPEGERVSEASIASFERWVESGAAPVDNGCQVAGMAPAPPAEQPPVMQDAGVGDAGAPDDSMLVPDAATPNEPLGDGWTMFGSDLTNSRSADGETTITADNASALSSIWRFQGPAVTSTPAVVDGVVYFSGWDGQVYARGAQDNGVVWTQQMPNLIDSSPLVTADRVFVSDDHGALHALDRSNGGILWSKQLDTHPQTHLWSSPVYIPDADLLVIGVASSEEMARVDDYVFRGSVMGLDAQDGSVRWQFHTSEDDASSGAGVSVWATATVDTDRGILYVGTGNAYEAPAGPYSDAMLAIRYSDGQLVWHHAFTADDVFVLARPAGPDFDIAAAANLFTSDGVDAVGVGAKSGLYHALDRDTGQLLWTAEIGRGGVQGGVMSASACDGETVYVASNDGYETAMVALDVDTGQARWRKSLASRTWGGVAHANGVVFIGTDDGTVRALDAMDGSELFSDVLPDAIAGGMSIANGTLFVPWGFQWVLQNGQPGTGGVAAYRVP